MKVQVGVSNRHLHLTEQDYHILCGDMPLEVKNPINQPGQYASNITFTIKTAKALINNVRLLGPLREYSQIEISKTDAYTLGINPPIRTSGDLKDSEKVTVIGPKGSIEIEGCIIANRHIHVDDEMIKYYHLEGLDKVNVLIKGDKPGIIGNVYLKKSDKAYFEMHIDLDDANAFFLKNGDIVDIIENSK